MLKGKMIYVVSMDLTEYPTKCKDCPAFRTSPYRCHNEVGVVGDCELGYMAHHDMRDFTGYKLFKGCKMHADRRVNIVPEVDI